MTEERAATSRGFWSAFGPGLLWAAAAIGVSHLVQSTRAGAMAGFGLVGVVLIANIVKYPFFEFGPRYAAATGESLVEGYQRIGGWALWLYVIITLATGLIVQSAIILLTSFLISYTFGLTLPLAVMGAVVCVASGGLLLAGRYRLLDGMIKVILVLLAVSTLAAAVVSLQRADFSTLRLLPEIGSASGVELAFLLALVGWMPSAIDIAVWSSLWTLAKDETVGSRASVRNTLLDFRIGYVGTVVMAFAFLTLGATVMHGSGRTFSPQGTRFSAELIELYAQVLGHWTIPIVATAVLTTMLSTAVTVIDGYPRAIARSVRVLTSGRIGSGDRDEMGAVYWIGLVSLSIGNVLVLTFFAGTLAAMIDFATTVSFLVAPILGYLNLRVVTSPAVRQEDQPGRFLIALSWIGLVLLGGFAIVYLVTL